MNLPSQVMTYRKKKDALPHSFLDPNSIHHLSQDPWILYPTPPAYMAAVEPIGKQFDLSLSKICSELSQNQGYFLIWEKGSSLKSNLMEGR